MKVAFVHEMCWNIHVSGAPFWLGSTTVDHWYDSIMARAFAQIPEWACAISYN